MWGGSRFMALSSEKNGMPLKVWANCLVGCELLNRIGGKMEECVLVSLEESGDCEFCAHDGWVLEF